MSVSEKELFKKSKKVLINLYLQKDLELDCIVSDYKEEYEKLYQENKKLKKEIRKLKKDKKIIYQITDKDLIVLKVVSNG